jgi:4'-phosphopantetheinyl transferase EntD
LITVLESLFPSPISCAWSDRPPSEIHLLPAEADAARNMRDKRLREFAHGRACARKALAALGFPECPVPIGEHRAPVWPHGIVGSISHTDDHAMAVAAQATDLKGLGIDLELKQPLDKTVLRMLCRPEEIARLRQPMADPVLSKILFSAKESVFKCIWPTVRRFVDFQELEIRLDLDTETFTAIPGNENLPVELIKKIRGRYALTEKLIVTAAYM